MDLNLKTEIKMKKNEFNKLFDPEVLAELDQAFIDMRIKQERSQITDDPYEYWYLELSEALTELEIDFMRTPQDDDNAGIIWVRSISEHAFAQINEKELDFCQAKNIPALAVAHAIKAGLISSIFRFWEDIKEDEEGIKEDE